VNINTADIEELDELPEVGPATAETIGPKDNRCSPRGHER